MAQEDVHGIGSMLSSHTLANNIISRHNTSDAVLDTKALTMLKNFCCDPSQKDTILTKSDMKDEPGQKPGTKAVKSKGSLVGMLIARYGTSEPGFTEGEVGELREWFEKDEDGEILMHE